MCRKLIEIANGFVQGVSNEKLFFVTLVFKFVFENHEMKNDPISLLGKW